MFVEARRSDKALEKPKMLSKSGVVR